MKKKSYHSISDIPKGDLENMMMEYARKKAHTVRTARAYLRSIGIPINHKGIIDESITSASFSY